MRSKILIATALASSLMYGGAQAALFGQSGMAGFCGQEGTETPSASCTVGTTFPREPVYVAYYSVEPARQTYYIEPAREVVIVPSETWMIVTEQPVQFPE
jgi:hypothetical protein